MLSSSYSRSVRADQNLSEPYSLKSRSWYTLWRDVSTYGRLHEAMFESYVLLELDISTSPWAQKALIVDASSAEGVHLP